jgi:hypothetical protein
VPLPICTVTPSLPPSLARLPQPSLLELISEISSSTSSKDAQRTLVTTLEALAGPPNFRRFQTALVTSVEAEVHAALDEKPLPAGVGVTEGGATPTAQLAAITQVASTYSALQLASMLEKLGDLAQRGRTDETMDAEGMRKVSSPELYLSPPRA